MCNTVGIDANVDAELFRHDWPDADCVTILRNIRRAMTKPNAKVLIREYQHRGERNRYSQAAR